MPRRTNFNEPARALFQGALAAWRDAPEVERKRIERTMLDQAKAADRVTVLVNAASWMDDLDGPRWRSRMRLWRCAPAQGRARGAGRRGGSACGYAWLSVSHGVGTAAVVGLAPASRPRAFIRISYSRAGRAHGVRCPARRSAGQSSKHSSACVQHVWRGVCALPLSRVAPCHKTGGLGLAGSGVIR